MLSDDYCTTARHCARAPPLPPPLRLRTEGIAACARSPPERTAPVYGGALALRPTVRLGRTGGLRVRACRPVGAPPPRPAVGVPQTLPPPRIAVPGPTARVHPRHPARLDLPSARAAHTPPDMLRAPPGKPLCGRLVRSGLSRGGKGKGRKGIQGLTPLRAWLCLSFQAAVRCRRPSQILMVCPTPLLVGKSRR